MEGERGKVFLFNANKQRVELNEKQQGLASLAQMIKKEFEANPGRDKEASTGLDEYTRAASVLTDDELAEQLHSYDERPRNLDSLHTYILALEYLDRLQRHEK